MDSKLRIVIIGGGFAGLNLVKKLDKERFETILIDRNNFHSFPPLFYQIASSGLDPSNICFPLRREMRKERARGTRYHMGEVRRIDFSAKEVETQYETIKYDLLVIAAGCTNNFFGNEELHKYVYTLKSAGEAMRIRNEILDRLERASLCTDDDLRRKMLSFVVVGGGPTGVEMAGALGEMKRDIVPREYPGIDMDEVRITLLEGAPKVLGAMSEKSSEQAKAYLKKLLVDVHTSTMLKEYKDNILTLADGSQIYSSMVIWTAGITGVKFEMEGGQPEMAPGGRFAVDEYNRVKGLQDVFAIGDIAYFPTAEYPKGLPQMAQVAIQQARLLAKQINRGQYTKAFKYKDKGSMATVGRNLAVADLPHMHFGGFFAWLTWMFIHLISILGMRNKVSVLINWIWAYCTYNTSLRILLHSTRYPLRRRWGER